MAWVYWLTLIFKIVFSNLREKTRIKKTSNSSAPQKSGMGSHSSLLGSTLPLTSKHADQEDTSSLTGSDFLGYHFTFQRTKWKGEHSSQWCFQSHQTCKISNTETADDVQVLQERQTTRLLFLWHRCHYIGFHRKHFLPLKNANKVNASCHPSYLSIFLETFFF